MLRLNLVTEFPLEDRIVGLYIWMSRTTQNRHSTTLKLCALKKMPGSYLNT